MQQLRSSGMGTVGPQIIRDGPSVLATAVLVNERKMSVKIIGSSQRPNSKLPLAIFVCICLVAFKASVTLGCECKAESTSRTIKRLRKTATVIFVGKVKEVRKEVKDYHIGYWATFDIEKSWKGEKPVQITIYTGGGCMAWFETGRTYLVYASPDSANRLSTDVCMRTRLIKYAAEDLRRLEKPQYTDGVTRTNHLVLDRRRLARRQT